MGIEDVIQYYDENKEDIELVREHGEPIARAMAEAMETFVSERGRDEGR